MVDEQTTNTLLLLIVSCALAQSSGCTICKRTVLCYTYMIVNKK